ncbi:hypothetical protein MKK50_06815 [Methylobacterium sp. J-043]|nr:hypothetical protein [Methylobacterium sp. J-043]
MSDSSAPASAPLTSSDPIELVIHLKAEYIRADEFCKEVQNFRDEAGIPAINEMRYVGYHLLHSIGSSNSACDVEELRKAIRHAQRATYEAAEAGIQIALREIDLFKSNYQLVTIGDVVKDWQDILVKRKEAERSLNQPREVGDNRDLDHERHKSFFRDLSSTANRLDLAREELNKKMAAERRLKIRFVVPICIAITAVCVTIMAALTR